MGQRSTNITKDYLIKAPLPTHGETYTVIPHQFVIDRTLEELATNGFAVDKELYKCNLNAQIAQGTYHIKYGNDPEVGMAFTWTNSYDKTTKFKSALGAYIHLSKGIMISGDLGQWRRKHTGNADNEIVSTIHAQISNAEVYFSELISDKEKMKKIVVDKKQIAEFIGYLYLDRNVITTEQISFVKGQYKKPDFEHEIPETSLWLMYNYLVTSLQRSHPRQWLDQQRMIHYLVTSEFGIRTYDENEKEIKADSTEKVPASEPEKEEVKIDPAQRTIHDQIEEMGAHPHMP